MSKHVLDVGNCDLDHGNIEELLEREFAAKVFRAHGARDAFALLDRQPFDLVLVNRILDRDGSEGLAIIEKIKADPRLAATPVMLITNFAEHQQAALAAGAEPGFGKSTLSSQETIQRLKRFLG